MDVLISKDKVIDLIMETDPEWAVGMTRAIFEGVQRMPPAERKKGRWKPFDLTWGRSIYFCTACNDATEVPTSYDKPVYKYCPWCGAEMRGEQDE